VLWKIDTQHTYVEVTFFLSLYSCNLKTNFALIFSLIIMAIEFLLSMYYVTDFTRLVRNEIRFLIVPS